MTGQLINLFQTYPTPLLVGPRLFRRTHWTPRLQMPDPKQQTNTITCVRNHPPPPKRKQKQKRIFGEILPKCGWVGWLIPKQAPNPSKPPQNHPFRSEFHLSQKAWGGWVNRFGSTLDALPNDHQRVILSPKKVSPYPPV